MWTSRDLVCLGSEQRGACKELGMTRGLDSDTGPHLGLSGSGMGAVEG